MKRYVLCRKPPSASGMPKIFEYEANPYPSSQAGVDICPACGRSAYGLNHQTDSDVNVLIIMRRNLMKERARK